MRKLLGICIGVTKVGWGLINCDCDKIIDSGVRIFDEADKSLNIERRQFRNIRRCIRRKKHRMERIRQILKSINFPVSDIYSIDPYEARKNCIYGKATRSEISRALIHLAKRRGSLLDLPEEDNYKKSEFSTKEQLKKNKLLLNSKYICEAQIEKIKSGKLRNYKNKFHTSDYLNEVNAILSAQKKYYIEIDANFCSKYLEIFSSKRKYDEGPGSYKSPTPYGRFLYNNGKINEISLINKNRGCCIVFSEENRMPFMSYTSNLFDLLNELNKVTVNGEHLSYDDKKYLISNYINKGISLTYNKLLKYLKKTRDNVTDKSICGINKTNDKKIFTEFNGYNVMIKYAEKNNLPTIIYQDKKLFDEIALVLTLYKRIDDRKKNLNDILLCYMDYEDANTVIDILKEDTHFKGYHLFSQKAIMTIMEDLWKTNFNYKQLFDIKGLSEFSIKENYTRNIRFDNDAVLSSSTKRSHREAIKIINRVRKLYGELNEIVVKVFNGKSYELVPVGQKKLIGSHNEFVQHIKKILGIESNEPLKITDQQIIAFRLWIQQNEKCIYSHKSINLLDILNNFDKLDIDYIIPFEFTFDESINNKVLCYKEEKIKKGTMTPFQYFMSGNASISYEDFKNEVLNLYKTNSFKLNYILEETDIKNNKQLREKYINTNFADTGYICRSFISTLSQYFSCNNIKTKVFSISNKALNAFYKKTDMINDIDAGYSYYAINALMIAYIKNCDMLKCFDECISECSVYKYKDSSLDICDNGYKYKDKISDNILKIKKFKDKIKYSHKVDKKLNRAACKQTIFGTKIFNDKVMIVNKFKDIYNLNKYEVADLIKKLVKTPEKFFIYHNNKDVYEKVCYIIDYYRESTNPFMAYKKDHGYILKDGKVPVKNFKYYSRELGRCIDITHKYKDAKNSVVMVSINTFRIDIYKNKDGTYKYIGLPFYLFRKNGNKYEIKLEEYEVLKKEYKRNIDSNYEFCFSLYKNDRFSYNCEKNGELIRVDCIFRSDNDTSKGKIEIDFVDHKKLKQAEGMKYISTFKNIVKYNVDVLGNEYEIKKEKGPKMYLHN